MATGTRLQPWIWRGSPPCRDRRADAHNVQANHSTLYRTRAVMAWKKTSHAQPLWASGSDRWNEDSAEIRVFSFQGPILREGSKGKSADCADCLKTRLTINVTVPFYLWSFCSGVFTPRNNWWYSYKPVYENLYKSALLFVL